MEEAGVSVSNPMLASRSATRAEEGTLPASYALYASVGGSGFGAGAGAAPGPITGMQHLLSQFTALQALRRATQRWLERKATHDEFELDMTTVPGIPVRELLTQVFTFERSRKLQEFAIYTFYVLCFVAVVMNINDSQVRKGGCGGPGAGADCA